MDGFGPPIEDARTPDGAMDALFRRYRTWLTAKLGYRYGRENAEDVVQETFLRMTRTGAATTARHPRALLMQIARNVAIDRFGDLNASLKPRHSSPTSRSSLSCPRNNRPS